MCKPLYSRRCRDWPQKCTVLVQSRTQSELNLRWTFHCVADHSHPGNDLITSLSRGSRYRWERYQDRQAC
ncbi:hypothetical protein ANANG_G00176600 [Anguilla anguilla]|uniref:Uncharacterized protein n=1 Tax=Anguilla anguilla TaxID=7936 RepID=A0A9D3M4F9_ANGAN|nr:hypothetical protein ANANG_G00176600 [Anguilla anguilla]